MYRLGMSNARLTTNFLWSTAIKINRQLRENNKKNNNKKKAHLKQKI